MTSPSTSPTGAQIIDGNALSQRFREQIAARVRDVRAAGMPVGLDAVLVESGDNGARVYADNQAKTCAALGIDYRLHLLPSTAGYDDIAGRVLLLSSEPKVTAIMLHMPLPAGIDPYRVQRLIAPEKDVEGVNPANIGNVVYGRSSLAPCTGLAVMRMIESVLPPRTDDVPLLRGKRAVVIGASDVVGKPIAVLLMRQEATVVSCNKFTLGIEDLARSADILVAAAGVPDLIKPDMVKPGAIVIDVGVNRIPGEGGKTRTVGDVAFATVRNIAGWISPVPGGVGPVTVSMLLLNVVEAAARALPAR
ncbi:MAG: bifunctional 5,10-methylenetetrahydrofolate dehydrogenase/5,10-methenyltetrahydrofolate cyclohydrolase [Planctomycetota bacterium]|nr:bifunctional 5,10-methylenetetrahydrofolate dehydrogenase/5,10-methenyltetrahydrofolate cyclohydrolase [Planctomycetota bacterium]